MKVKTDYAKCSYVIPGKEYEIKDFNSSNRVASVSLEPLSTGRQGIDFIVIDKNVGCPHLDFVGYWEIVEEDE